MADGTIALRIARRHPCDCLACSQMLTYFDQLRAQSSKLVFGRIVYVKARDVFSNETWFDFKQKYNVHFCFVQPVFFTFHEFLFFFKFTLRKILFCAGTDSFQNYILIACEDRSIIFDVVALHDVFRRSQEK